MAKFNKMTMELVHEAVTKYGFTDKALKSIIEVYKGSKSSEVISWKHTNEEIEEGSVTSVYPELHSPEEYHLIKAVECEHTFTDYNTKEEKIEYETVSFGKGILIHRDTFAEWIVGYTNIEDKDIDETVDELSIRMISELKATTESLDERAKFDPYDETLDTDRLFAGADALRKVLTKVNKTLKNESVKELLKAINEYL